MTEKQYENYKKKEDILNKFPAEFRELYGNDAMATRVVDYLAQKDDPYKLLSDIIIQRSEETKEAIKRAELFPQPLSFVYCNKCAKDLNIKG